MAGYDPSQDVIVWQAQECQPSGGQQGFNTLYLNMRSYNGGEGKLEFSRNKPNQNNPNQMVGFRLNKDEWELLKKYAGQIDQLFQQSPPPKNPHPPVSVQERPYPQPQQQQPQQQQPPQQGFNQY